MTWDVLNIIGTLAFAVSGALVAMEEKYDIFGIMILGFTTAFGGGTIRNLLLGIPVEDIWAQGNLFILAFIAILVVFMFPTHWWVQYWKRWGIFFDAIGLASFAIQGALMAVHSGASLAGAIVAATLTGAGGGMIRDVFAGRKPMIFHDEIYALWASLGGLLIGLGLINSAWMTGALLAVIVLLRMLSVHYKWSLPRGSLS
ncbi:hypothetical protein AV656_14715 [Bhargavaea cecembensis]|uniref:Glycine transporter domain-containing protein n=1 Tax=Bhargavaea cecembensis TaxID=394098 RepID=A0A161RAT3_9BACL|nr:trimeric intracellular cation channel family protein [Bhargavaea cecembensis]KZE36392.1 hypothetical protein AV656_14715 [Bhargavaea cecembensis]